MLDKTLLIGINLGDFGSTGTIMRNTFEYAHEHCNFDYLIIVPTDKGKPNTYAYAYKRNLIQKIIDCVFFLSRYKPDGFKYYFFSKRIINKINLERKKYKKCIVHIHNIHHCDINLKVLFRGLSKMNVKIIFTLHDAWAFTGGCYYYNFKKCIGWKNGCRGICPQFIGNKVFSAAYIYRNKKKFFELIKEKTILVSVSNWLTNEVKQSFLKDFKVTTIYGETSLKKLDAKDTELKRQLCISEKYILMTVSSYWNEWKGTKYLYELVKLLPKNYVLLVVGGKFNIKSHKNIIHIENVNSEMINHYYSIADVYISTSQDESLGLTTCEAQICGVPVVAFGHSGVKETISSKSGYIIGEDNNINRFVEKIIYICEKNPFKKVDIINNGMRFAKYEHAKKILEIYENC